MVYFVGAGFGSAELITVRGLKLIEKADVIIYDSLIDPTLLGFAREGCILIHAGKRAGGHSTAQAEINELLVKYGKTMKVARLKGGDSFVFGRGGEEIDCLVENGIDFEMAAGVSVSYGAAEYAGIPVTHRDAAQSFHVITGHEKNGGENVDYSALAALNGTLVFMMGLGNAEIIAEKLIQNGKNPETPAAVISDAACAEQKCVTGSLKSLASLAGQMKPPAVIVVGDVVNYRHGWYKPSGRNILVTGTDGTNARLRDALGGVTEISLIKTVRINYEAFEKLDLSGFSHIAFTSANGVGIFFEYMRRAQKDIRALAGVNTAAVGEATASALCECGIIADIVPDIHTGAALAYELKLHGAKNVLLIRAENGATGLSDGLKKFGIPYTDMPLYRTETDFAKKEILNLTAPRMDCIIFSSGSAARAYAQLAECETRAKFISIGKETTRTAVGCGIKIYKTASRASAEGIAEIMGDERSD